ncbi:unnamed protein product [Symbiodinium sp. CCMP2592]|nr:unnamed protein product [Symbiodinium sp. CCMP2592]
MPKPTGSEIRQQGRARCYSNAVAVRDLVLGKAVESSNRAAGALPGSPWTPRKPGTVQWLAALVKLTRGDGRLVLRVPALVRGACALLQQCCSETQAVAVRDLVLGKAVESSNRAAGALPGSLVAVDAAQVAVALLGQCSGWQLL